MLHISTTQTGHVSLIEQSRRFFGEIARTHRERIRQREARQGFLNLRHLDDRTLDDMGLTRADIYNAAELPLHVNAAQMLRQTAARRKAKQAFRRP